MNIYCHCCSCECLTSHSPDFSLSLWLVKFIGFCDVNIPAVAGFQAPNLMSLSEQLEREARDGLPWALGNSPQHIVVPWNPGSPGDSHTGRFDWLLLDAEQTLRQTILSLWPVLLHTTLQQGVSKETLQQEAHLKRENSKQDKRKNNTGLAMTPAKEEFSKAAWRLRQEET